MGHPVVKLPRLCDGFSTFGFDPILIQTQKKVLEDLGKCGYPRSRYILYVSLLFLLEWRAMMIEACLQIVTFEHFFAEPSPQDGCANSPAIVIQCEEKRSANCQSNVKRERVRPSSRRGWERRAFLLTTESKSKYFLIAFAFIGRSRLLTS